MLKEKEIEILFGTLLSFVLLYGLLIFETKSLKIKKYENQKYNLFPVLLNFTNNKQGRQSL